MTEGRSVIQRGDTEKETEEQDYTRHTCTRQILNIVVRSLAELNQLLSSYILMVAKSKYTLSSKSTSNSKPIAIRQTEANF